MQRIDKEEGKPKRINVTITNEQAEYIDALIKGGVYKSAAEYLRHLIELDMGSL